VIKEPVSIVVVYISRREADESASLPRVLKAMAAPGTAGRIGRDHAGVALPSALLLVAGAGATRPRITAV